MCGIKPVSKKLSLNQLFNQFETLLFLRANNIMMVEGEMDEVPESALLEALKVAHEAIKPMWNISWMCCSLGKQRKKRL